MTDSDKQKQKMIRAARGKKIRAAMLEHGIQNKDLAIKIGVDQSIISKMLSGERDIKADEMEAIVSALGDAQHIIGIHRERDSIDEQTTDKLTEYNDLHLRMVVSSVGYSGDGIPEVDVLVGAGEGAEGDILNISLGDETYSGHSILAEWQIPDEYTRYFLNVSPRQSVIMQIVGDSMSPTYNHGDRILVDMRHNSLSLDGVYVISDGHSPPQVKRLQRVLFSNPQAVDIVSDNPSHSTQRVELDPLRVIGRVACKIQAT